MLNGVAELDESAPIGAAVAGAATLAPVIATASKRVAPNFFMLFS